jgi:hypothetical protein
MQQCNKVSRYLRLYLVLRSERPFELPKKITEALENLQVPKPRASTELVATLEALERAKEDLGSMKVLRDIVKYFHVKTF